MDSFYIGKLKRAGKVYQLTAVDTRTRWAMVWLVHGVVNKDVSLAFFERIWTTWSKMWFPIEAIVADNGPEYEATAFADALAAKNVERIKIPGRSPNHGAVVERFQGTMLQECWHPALHRLSFNSVRQLQREADACLHTYNHHRRNHSDYTNGRRPAELLELLSSPTRSQTTAVTPAPGQEERDLDLRLTGGYFGERLDHLLLRGD